MVDVSIVVVAYNDATDLPRTLTSAVGQEGVSVELIVVDNASSDRSRDVAAVFAPQARIVALPENVGFAAGMNCGIEASSGRYVLALNPDCRLEPDFAALLASRLNYWPDVGSASGRIYRAEGRELSPISSSTARMPTSPGACGASAGSVCTCRGPWRTTAGATCPSGAGR